MNYKRIASKILLLITVVLLALISTSCSSEKKIEKATETAEDEPSICQQVVTPEIEQRQPVYVYGSQKIETSKNVTLKLSSEPLLLASGYVRLVGVVSGGKPIALVEVGGKGFCVENGDEVGEYVVVKIYEKSVQIVKKEII